MVKLFKIHKYSGLFAGVVLFILAITGFFLDHKNWSFMYDIHFENVPVSVYANEKKLIEAYWIDPKDEDHVVVGSRRGVFEKHEDTFEKKLNLQCLALRSDKDTLYAATSAGIYILQNDQWKLFALENEFVNAISIKNEKLLASVDKKDLLLLDLKGNTLSRTKVLINEDELHHDIKLARFVRDLHYGRGLFDGVLSLLINDYGAIILSVLSFTGYLIWFMIKKKKAKVSRKLIKIHANILVIIALIPFVILAITGIFLDHSKLLGSFMRSVTISHTILPPVYDSLQEDIWSVDLDTNVYRIGNRYGVYESKNFKEWKLVNKGFAYKMKHIENALYVSGMGAPNRVFKNETWFMFPKTPHMFKDISIIDGETIFLAHKHSLELPEVNDVSLYALLLSLHDGTFFSSWWVWINDIMAILLLVLGVTGTIRYLRKKRLL